MTLQMQVRCIHRFAAEVHSRQGGYRFRTHFCKLLFYYSVFYRHWVYSKGPPTRNSYDVSGVSFRLLIVAQGQATSYITFLIHRRYWNVVFLYEFSCSCRLFGNGVPCLEFSMPASAGSGKRRPQSAATSNKVPGTNNLETKYNVRTQSRYLCVLHSCRPSTRSAIRCTFTLLLN